MIKFDSRFNIEHNTFIPATILRLDGDWWYVKEGLLRVTGTLNLPNNILNTKALGRKTVPATSG